jgi:hypothetical protein
MAFRLPALVLLLGLFYCPLSMAANPKPISGGGVVGLDLKTQLEKGLLVRRPIEFAYIAEIVRLVEEGKLPRQLVTSTFVWARNMERRRLQYFQFALQARARKLDVELPDLRKLAVGVNLSGGQHGVNTSPIPSF